ncbi:NUT1 [Candida pseudojiufengensis]|uniref:NUT1 n=1 Tax=Candida pseudojiufengensis TaxID=497109 RepID=UPI00222424DB|nr:NUT1 [Candida pseudojiufengensis]KAI5962495.1 NUT1 [Candida pseudojiufengensis]
MNFEKLLQERLSTKSFLLLSALCSPSDEELYNVLGTTKNDHQIQLIIDWSLTTKSKSEQFWNILRSIDEPNRYLQKFIGANGDKFVYDNFIKFAKTHLENPVVLQLFGTFNLVDDDLIEIFTLSNNLKIQHLLTNSQLQKLTDLNLITQEHSEISLKLIKVDAFYEVRRKMYIYQLTKDFTKLQASPEQILKHFKTLCTGDVSQQLMESFPITTGYHLFNVENFKQEKVPNIIKLLNEEPPIDNRPPPNLKKLKELINEDGEFSIDDELFKFFQSLIQSSSQLEYTHIILSSIDDFISTKQFDKLNRLLLALINTKDLINIILFQSGYSILYKLLDYIDFESFNSDDEFQELYSYCSIGLLTIIYIIEIFQINLSNFEINSFTISFLNNFYYRLIDNLTNNLPELDNDEQTIITNYNNLTIEWITALFNADEGLSDDLIKSLNIKQIYKFMPIIYKQAILATDIGSISFQMLNNGLDYLSQTFLLPITVCLIKWIKRNGNELQFKIDSIDSNVVNVIKEIINHNTNVVVDKNINFWDNFKTYDFNKFELLKNKKLETIYYIIQQTAFITEESKLFINVLISFVVSESISNENDKEYWKNQLTNNIPSSQAPPQESSFTSSIDNHYSSIFNDDQKDVDEIDEFFNEEDIEMKISTSEQLQKQFSIASKIDCFLYYFIKIKNSINVTNLYYNTVNTLVEKFIEEIDNFEI